MSSRSAQRIHRAYSRERERSGPRAHVGPSTLRQIGRNSLPPAPRQRDGSGPASDPRADYGEVQVVHGSAGFRPVDAPPVVPSRETGAADASVPDGRSGAGAVDVPIAALSCFHLPLLRRPRRACLQLPARLATQPVVGVLVSLATYAQRLSAAVGRLTAWLTVLMIGVGALNAIARYAGKFTGANLSSNAYIELQWYLFSAVFLLGAADALREDAHVRVDVFYGRVSAKTRDVIDLAGTVIFLIPFCCFAIIMSWPAIRNSLAVLEGSPDPGGLPRYPVKLLIPVCFGLLIIQGVAQALRAGLRLSGHLPREQQ